MTGTTPHGIRYPDGASRAKNLGPELQQFAEDVDKFIDEQIDGQSAVFREEAEEASAIAVANEIAARELVETTSDRLLTEVDGSDDFFGVFGGRGEHTAATVRQSDGGPSDAAELILRERLGLFLADGSGTGFATADGDVTALQVDPATGLLTRDAADLQAESARGYEQRAQTWARTSVRVPTASGARLLVPSRTALSIHGDSHAQASDVPEPDRWHNGIAAARPDLSMTHHSRGGATGHVVAILAGAMEATFTLAGGTIPASGTVGASIQADVKWRLDTTFPATPGVLITPSGVEVPVTATRASGSSAWEFARTTPGAAIPAPTARFRADAWANAGGSLPLVIAGRNDQITTPTSIGPAIEGYIAIMESRTPLVPHAFLMGMPLDAGWAVGSRGWMFGRQLDLELARMWPEHHWSLQRWLVEDALTATGIAPTSADLTARDRWQTPPSLLLGDGIHMNAITQAALWPVVIAELVRRDLIAA